MKWNNEMCLKLVEDYEKYPILWNSKHPDHFSREKKANAWDCIAENFDLEVFELKQKMNSLKGSFRRERAKGTKRVASGKGRQQIFISKWFAFERMGYLLDHDEPLTSVNTAQKIEYADDDTETVHNINSDGDSIGVQSVSETIDSSVPLKKKRKLTIPGPRLEEPYQIIGEPFHTNPPDSFSVYGQHVANKLRSYSKNTQTEVEHAVNNILYTADKGVYDRPTPP